MKWRRAPGIAILGVGVWLAPAGVRAGVIVTVAGTGTAGYNADGIGGVYADLFYPYGVAATPSGTLYIADGWNNRVRRVEATTGTIFTAAGTGTGGCDAGPLAATSAELFDPYGVAVDASGNFYVSTDIGSVVQRVNAVTGVLTTVAGDCAGSGFNGDWIAATTAWLDGPSGIAVDAAGNLFIADRNNNLVRRVDAATGRIHAIAGTGTAGYNSDGIAALDADLWLPYGVAVDRSGTVYIADPGNNRVRKVFPSGTTYTTIATAAGTGTKGYNADGIPAATAQLNHPYGVAVDAAGNLFIADSDNNRVRRVDAATGIITTIAGTGTAGYTGDGEAATSAQIWFPSSVAVDAAGNVYFTDQANHRVRKILVDAPPGGGGGGTSSTPLTAGLGTLLIAPNVLDASAAGQGIVFLAKGDPNGLVEVRIFDSAGQAMGILRIPLDANGEGRTYYTKDGVGGRRPGPGLYWALAAGGGVNDRRKFMVVAGGR